MFQYTILIKNTSFFFFFGKKTNIELFEKYASFRTDIRYDGFI